MLWPFRPQKTIQETFQWKTDILPTLTGEQRIAARLDPRRILEYTFQGETEGALMSARTAVGSLFDQLWDVPIWTNIGSANPVDSGELLLTGTSIAYTEIGEGSRVLLASDAGWELNTVAAIDGMEITLGSETTLAHGNLEVVPVTSAYLNGPATWQRYPAEYWQGRVAFLSTETPNIPATAFPNSFLGYPVFPYTKEMVGSAEEQASKEIIVFDNGFGQITPIRTKKYASLAHSFGLSGVSKQEVWSIKSGIFSLRGKQKAFWLPSGDLDIVPTSSISNLTDSFFIQKSFWEHAALPFYIEVTHAGGTTYFVVTEYSSVDENTAQLTFSETPAASITLGDIQRISFMNLSRMDTDSFSFSHYGVDQASVSFPLVTVGGL